MSYCCCLFLRCEMQPRVCLGFNIWEWTFLVFCLLVSGSLGYLTVDQIQQLKAENESETNDTCSTSLAINLVILFILSKLPPRSISLMDSNPGLTICSLFLDIQYLD